MPDIPGSSVSTATSTTPSAQPGAVHPHPIRWDVDRQLWVRSPGLCDFTRPKREGEVVPSREDARVEAMRAGSGADFADLRSATASPSVPNPTPASGAPSSSAA